jgi:signal transduction histidine kinase
MLKKSAVSFLSKAERQRWRQSIAVALCFGALLVVVKAQTPTEELHTVAAIRGLTVEQTRQKIPVRLHGVVTFFDENLYSRFIQDETVGIYLQFPLNVAPPMLVPGQFVEVTGVASPGEYAPVVLVDTVRVTDKRPLPLAKPVTYEQLASGAEDSQFVETAGIVRSVRKLEGSPYHQIEIVTGGGRLLIFANELPVQHPEELLDSTVRVRGVCSTQFNHQRQLFAIRLMVPRPDDLTIVIPATKDPFAIPARAIGSLLQFTPQETYGHRVKVLGTVNYFEPGTGIFLQDGEHGVEVQTKELGPLQLGDRVEVLGFVNHGDYTPLLQDAVYRTISAGKLPTPSKLTHDEALKGGHDCQLVQIVARLIDRTQHGSEQFLILQESNFIFQASLKQTGGHDNFALLENNSRVAVTGVCRIEPGEWQAGENWRAKSFSIRLRSPDDVVLLEAPPWWTLKRVLWIATALGFVALAAFSWVAVLRRRVTERTRELEIQIQKRQTAERRREIEQERARVAHDLHDDLGSGLTEVNMLTTLVKSPMTSVEEKERYLGDLSETARRMVNSLDEIVWAVNPRNDTIASLASYFGSYAQRLLDLASVACGLAIAEDLPEHPLDPKFRQELFFAFKEALTNVVRHAGATQVWLRISVHADNLLVEVEDNGIGFDLRERQAGSDGIANMNERMKSLGGQCEIKTDPQKGTSIQFRAPLPGKFL